MQIAVGVDSLHLVALAQGETDLGGLAGLQRLALVALLGLDGDSPDMVFFHHGMLHRTTVT